MRYNRLAYLAVFIICMVSCLPNLAPDAQTPAIEKTAVQITQSTDTPMSSTIIKTPIATPLAHLAPVPTVSYVLEAVLQGEWSVEVMVLPNRDWKRLGTLTINEDTYKFHPIYEDKVTAYGMKDRFCFFDQPDGQVTFEYESGVSPDDDIRTFNDRAILIKCYGIGCDEYFFIKVDQEKKMLYFHAWYSEIQTWRIRKSYKDQVANQ